MTGREDIHMLECGQNNQAGGNGCAMMIGKSRCLSLPLDANTKRYKTLMGMIEE